MKKLMMPMVVLLLFSLVACAAPQGAQPAATSAVQQTQTTAGQTAAAATTSEQEPEPDSNAYEKPLVVSMNVTEAEKCGTHVRNEYIKERFNLTFEYIPINTADWNESIRTWIATDDAPDLIYWNLKGAQANEYKSWSRQGAFSPFLAEYFDDRPLLKEVYDTSPSIAALTVNDNLYGFPSLRDNPVEAENCYGSNWCYRRDWAIAVGKYKDDDIYTWDEWLDLIRTVLKEDPGDNGPGVTAGLLMPPATFPGGASLFINPPAAEGNETCTYIEVDGQYVWPPALDDYKKSVKATYDMYQEGLIYRDNILFKGNEHRDMIEAGLGFAAYNINGSLNAITERMLRDNVIDDYNDFGIAIVSAWDGNWYMTQTEDFWCITALSHKIGQEKIDRVLDFWEYLKTDDGIRLRWLGIEGVDFVRTGDGLRDLDLLWEKDPATGGYIDPYVNYAFIEAAAAENPRQNPPGSVPYQYDEIDRLWAIRASGRLPNLLKPFDYFVTFGSAPNKDIYGSFGAETKARIVSLMAQPDIDIEAEWDKYVAEKMPDVQLVLDEINGGKME
ncbi:MAG: hypothetical protein FWH01_10630 [Oscillospiraceae bacterium]|nr:hypothetical protein [Oscillospiraceae bacterium]